MLDRTWFWQNLLTRKVTCRIVWWPSVPLNKSFEHFFKNLLVGLFRVTTDNDIFIISRVKQGSGGSYISMLLKQGGYTKLFYYFHFWLFSSQRGVDWLISSIEPSESPPSPPLITKTTCRSLKLEKETTIMVLKSMTLSSLFNL